jgi:hypothetical protein
MHEGVYLGGPLRVPVARLAVRRAGPAKPLTRFDCGAAGPELPEERPSHQRAGTGATVEWRNAPVVWETPPLEECPVDLRGPTWMSMTLRVVRVPTPANPAQRLGWRTASF